MNIIALAIDGGEMAAADLSSPRNSPVTTDREPSDELKGAKPLVRRSLPRRGLGRLYGPRLPAFSVALLLLAAGLLALISHYERAAQEADLDLKRVRILGGGEDYLNLEVEFRVDNPAPLAASVSVSELYLLADGKRVGSLQLPGFDLHSGLNRVVLPANLTETSPGSLSGLAAVMLDDEGEKANLALEGSARAESLLDLDLIIDRPLELGESLSELAVEVTAIEVRTDDTGIFAAIAVTVDNPSIIEIALDELAFDILWQGSHVTTLQPEGLLVIGENLLEFSVFIPAADQDIYNPLVAALLDETPLAFDVFGHGAADSLLSRLAESYSFTYLVEEEDHIKFEVSSFAIEDLGLLGSQIGIEALVDNPTDLEANLSGFNFSVYYRDEFLSPMTLHDVELAPGLQTLQLSLFVDTLKFVDIGIRISFDWPIPLLIIGQRPFVDGYALTFQLTLTLNEAPTAT